jgi:tetratricopeptide (TPR) repeat protein
MTDARQAVVIRRCAGGRRRARRPASNEPGRRSRLQSSAPMPRPTRSPGPAKPATAKGVPPKRTNSSVTGGKGSSKGAGAKADSRGAGVKSAPKAVAAKGAPVKGSSSRGASPKAAPAKRRSRVRATQASEELRRLAGRNAASAIATLERAAAVYRAEREREALRVLRPLLDAYPDAGAVRELAGLCHYRLGNYRAAQRELEAFVALSNSTESHPVLMDACRATGQFRRVEQLWRELGEASPSAALVTEGRIVMAGALADRGRSHDAITLLERRSGGPIKRPAAHQLRLWYALGDLYERTGNLPRARSLFRDIARAEPGFADVAERLAGLG